MIFSRQLRNAYSLCGATIEFLSGFLHKLYALRSCLENIIAVLYKNAFIGRIGNRVRPIHRRRIVFRIVIVTIVIVCMIVIGIAVLLLAHIVHLLLHLRAAAYIYKTSRRACAATAKTSHFFGQALK